MAYVLVVDDEDSIRALLRRQLEKWGYRVMTAASALDALELIRADPPSIALIDLRMPQIDGFWLAERIRDNWPATRIVITSGVGDIEAIERAKNLGVVAYVVKPFDRELLRQAMERAGIP